VAGASVGDGSGGLAVGRRTQAQTPKSLDDLLRLVLLAADILVVFVALGCASGRIGVNQLAGIRTRNVMASDEAWRVGHKAAIPATLIGSGVAAGLISISFFPFDRDVQGGLILAGAGVWLICLVIGAVFANRAAVKVLALGQ
jgi:hypothetical protein